MRYVSALQERDEVSVGAFFEPRVRARGRHRPARAAAVPDRSPS